MAGNDLKDLPIPKLIPEVSYDIICRVIPGALVIGCILWLCRFDIAIAEFDLFIGLFLIALAYAIGLIIDSCLNHLLNPLLIRYSWEIIISTCQKNEKLEEFTRYFNFEMDDVKEDKFSFSLQKPHKLLNLILLHFILWLKRFILSLWHFILWLGRFLYGLLRSISRSHKDKNDKKNDPYALKKVILETLREHVVTNFPYATSMMPKLNAEAAMPRNLGVGLLLVSVLAVYCKILGWICREGSLLLWLIPLLVGAEFALYCSAKHRFHRTILRTLYWFWECQKKHEQLKRKQFGGNR